MVPALLLEFLNCSFAFQGALVQPKLPAPGNGSKEHSQLIALSKLRRFFQKISPGSRLISARVLEGGISAEMVLCELQLPEGTLQKLILRQPNANMLAQRPQTARDEFLLLQHLKSLQVGAPVPIALDDSGSFFSDPVLLIEYIEGGLDFSRRNASNLAFQMGKRLAMIHEVNPGSSDLSFLPLAPLDLEMTIGGWPPKTNQLSLDPALRQKMKAAWPFRHSNPPVLVHGDFWPGNILWQQNQLAGVIDWEDAMLGEPLIDVAICRLDLTFIYDRETTRIFTETYLAHHPVDISDLPGWDLIAAFRLARLAGSDLTSWCAFFIPYGRGDITPSNMKEAFKNFTAESLSQFSSG